MTVTGINELEKGFKNFLGDVQAFQIGEIINFALAQIEVEAKSKAPVLTGALRDSIVHYMITDLSGECLVQVPYAAAQEYGFTTPGGFHVPGKKYFTPAAIHGKATFLTELNKYLKTALTGVVVRPPRAPRGSRGGGGGASGGVHKYLQKIRTGAGYRYVYAKTTVPTKFRFQANPGGRKQPSTRFHRPKPKVGRGR